ncbi:hypothetical protein [Shewanella glacialipiscicola]|uniref:hypothetical protein n=1 Tax=Shewanella glacialipiscicola TaxID=614069 RepID=UPI003D7AEEC2
MQNSSQSDLLYSSFSTDDYQEHPPLSSYADIPCLAVPDGNAYSVEDETRRLKIARKAERDKINAEIKRIANIVKKKGVAVGFKGKVASYNGFKAKRLPDFVQTLLTQSKLLPYRDDFLERGDGLCRGKTQARSKVILGYMLSAFVVHCNVNNGHIVVATRHGGKNVTHDELRKEVAMRHGVYIAESTWYFYVNRLVQCGHIESHTVSVYEDGHVASFHAEASHKYLSSKLMAMLGADRLSVRTAAAKHDVDLKLSGKSFKQKPRYASSRYRQDGSLRQNMPVVKPSQELLALIRSHYEREAYYAPPN